MLEAFSKLFVSGSYRYIASTMAKGWEVWHVDPEMILEVLLSLLYHISAGREDVK